MRKHYDEDGLNEAARKVISKWGTKGDYAQAMIRKYSPQPGESWGNRNVQFEDVILPAWVIRPGDGGSIGWRMGSGESYITIFCEYLETLSREEYKIYRETYPIPRGVYHYMLGCMPEKYLTPREKRYLDNDDTSEEALYSWEFRDEYLVFGQQPHF